MGIVCFQAAVIAMFLPETNGRPTLETLDDMMKGKSGGPVVMSDLVIENANQKGNDVQARA